jgi:hypothetical protein
LLARWLPTLLLDDPDELLLVDALQHSFSRTLFRA